MKTHVVIDLVLTEEEGGGVIYAGTEEQCLEWISSQGFGYECKPMTKEEYNYYNHIDNE